MAVVLVTFAVLAAACTSPTSSDTGYPFDPATELTSQTYVGGDSVVAAVNGWARQLGPTYKNIAVLSSGWVRPTTKEFIPDRILREISEAGVPKRVVASGGVNDESSGSDLAAMEASAENLMAELDALGVEFWFVTPPPRRGTHNVTLLIDWRNYWLTEHPDKVIDCGPVLGWPYGNENYYADSLHPNAAGHDRLATCVRGSGKLDDLA